MLTFLVCLTALVIAYFTYGRYLERVVSDRSGGHETYRAKRSYDGVDYVPLPRWRIFPDPAAQHRRATARSSARCSGAALRSRGVSVDHASGGIFMGAAHDFLAGRHARCATTARAFPKRQDVTWAAGMRQSSCASSRSGCSILVGAVFLSQPASLSRGRLDVPSARRHRVRRISRGCRSSVLGRLILAYYFAATLLPVDKIIGQHLSRSSAWRCMLMAARHCSGVLLFGGAYTDPGTDDAGDNCISSTPHALPIVPTLFIDHRRAEPFRASTPRSRR